MLFFFLGHRRSWGKAEMFVGTEPPPQPDPLAMPACPSLPAHHRGLFALPWLRRRCCRARLAYFCKPAVAGGVGYGLNLSKV